jgi:putative hydrolase
VPSPPQGEGGIPGDADDDDSNPGSPFSGAGSDLPGFSFAGFDLSGIDLSSLARALQSSGPINWEVASQLAAIVATGGEAEPSIDATASDELEQLVRAAQTHVVSETGLVASTAATLHVINRKEWTTVHLDALKPVLERLATTLGGAFAPEVLFNDQPDPSLEPLASVLPMLAPLLLGVQAGSMIGYLAQHALGRYDLPLPAADAPSLTFVVRNLDEFESDWSLERTDLRFYVSIHEVVHAAIRSVPWVRERMVDIATEYVSGYVVDPTILNARLGDVDPSDPTALQSLAERPDELLNAMRSDAQTEVLERVRALHAAIEGYADAILERVGRPLIPTFDRIHEAIARHRIERGDAERFVGGLLGLATSREDYERGAAFCAGVIERAGNDGLNRLWERVEMIPTPNEIDAPGLWLARIDLDLDDAV